MKPGEYESYIQKKGINEAFIENINEGEVFYTVQLDENGGFDTKSQAEAEILSRLVRIENMLKKVEE